MMEALGKDPERNQLIADDVVREITEGEGGPLLVLTEDEVQDRTLEEMFNARGISSIFFDPVASERQSFSEQLRTGKSQVILANRRFFQQMFPEVRFDALFLTTPLNFRDQIIRSLQRLLKQNDGQPLVKIYDYVDSKISILDNFFRMRSYAYGLRLPRPTPPV